MGFSMLRQSPRDMDFVQSTMKQVLYDFGWSELKGHDDKPFKLSEDDAREMEEYLSKMGIKRENISDSLKKEMPWAFGDATFGASDFGGSRSDSDDEDPRSVVTNVFDVELHDQAGSHPPRRRDLRSDEVVHREWAGSLGGHGPEGVGVPPVRIASLDAEPGWPRAERGRALRGNLDFLRNADHLHLRMEHLACQFRDDPRESGQVDLRDEL